MRTILIPPQTNYPYTTPSLDLIPQGPAYVAGTLRARGHEVYGVCTNYETSGSPAPAVLKRKLTRAVAKFEPELIAIGGMAAEYLFLRDAIRFARAAAPDVPIVCGGSIMTNDRAAFEMLRPDFAVMDEAELPMAELIDRLQKGASLEGLENVAYWKDGEPVYNPLRNANYDLDDLPYPDYEPLDIRSYFELLNQTDGYFHVSTQTRPRMLPLSSGRSCPFKCTFCQYSVLGGSRRKYRGRSMKAVVDEITHFHGLYEFNILKIYDDLFSVKPDRIYEFCELLKATGLEIDWNASMRVGDVTPDLLRAMKDAGCFHIGYGFESADDTVLQSMNKQITQRQLEAAIRMSEDVGIGVQANFIFGDPAETPETVANTRRFYTEHCIDHIVHNDYIMPYPGSPIFDQALARGVIHSKEDYYASIHLRPRFNMTGMSEQEFQASIEPIIRWKLAGCRFAQNVRISKAPREGFAHSYFESKDLFAVDATCPHCERSVRYVFPLPPQDLDRWSGRAFFVHPIRYYCHHCHKRLLVSMLSVAGLEDSFDAWVKEVNRVAEAGTPVVIAPTVSHAVIDSCIAYGLRFDDLAIHSFLHRGAVAEGMQVLGHAVWELERQNVQRSANLEYVVLPDAGAQEVARQLEQFGVPRERVHWVGRRGEEDPVDGIDRYRQRIREELVGRGNRLIAAGGIRGRLAGRAKELIKRVVRH